MNTEDIVLLFKEMPEAALILFLDLYVEDDSLPLYNQARVILIRH